MAGRRHPVREIHPSIEFWGKHALAKSQQTARFAPTIVQNDRFRWRFANRPLAPWMPPTSS
ncbi:hypothetical protein CBM2634_A80069 [Cupriavidus taiwanensis]|uniref:Uncharacterized protein n=1 Tax=Cupriavidus taiwanensis TaxID=164546 RepID=A0A375J1Z0_9BURK|nr:hypothetical protein CBM2634_A80069 [Cupriavidus taiwanensis]